MDGDSINLNEYIQKCFYKYFIINEKSAKNSIEDKNRKMNEKPIIYIISKDQCSTKKDDKIIHFNIMENDADIKGDNEEYIIKDIDDYKLIDIPDIPDEYQQNNFEIINEFYQKIIDETIILPRIIKESIQKSNLKLLEKCNNTFNIMYYLYSINQN